MSTIFMIQTSQQDAKHQNLKNMSLLKTCCENIWAL